MNSMLKYHFNVQKGMYFDYDVVWGNWTLFMSNIIEDGFWNYAIMPELCNIDQELTHIEELFKKANRPSSIYIVNEKKCAHVMEYLKEHGYEKMAEESFMVYENTSEPSHLRNDVIVKRATISQYYNDFLEVFTNAYGGEKTPEQPYGELDKSYMDALARSFNNINKFYHYVCFIDGKPVSIASLCYENGKGGIYNVGTNPCARGQGFGTVATMACVDEWQNLGGNVLLLQTETGSKVEDWYSSLGFKPIFFGSTYCKE